MRRSGNGVDEHAGTTRGCSNKRVAYGNEEERKGVRRMRTRARAANQRTATVASNDPRGGNATRASCRATTRQTPRHVDTRREDRNVIERRQKELRCVVIRARKSAYRRSAATRKETDGKRERRQNARRARIIRCCRANHECRQR